MIRQICAWCKNDIQIIEENKHPDEDISHGICDSCFRKIVAEDSESLVEFLDSIKNPVFIVGDDVRVLAASEAGKKLVGKDIDHIKNHLGGEVFECAYSKLPGGCGRQIHCKNCVIRNAVMETLDTGKPQYKIPAKLNHGEVGDISKVQFYISVEKKGNSVLLRIDEI